MIAALLAVSLIDGFRVYQYTPKTVVVRGCTECAGEPDETCQIPAGFQTRSLPEYARGRWPAEGRLKLLVSSADPDCAVVAKNPRGTIELAAIHLSASPPPQSLVAGVGAGVRGWPRAPTRRSGDELRPTEIRRASLREAMVCWPAKTGWPASSGANTDARVSLDSANACERWLLAVTAAGLPDPAGVSFRIGPAMAFGDAHFTKAMESLAPADATTTGEAVPKSSYGVPTSPAPAAVPQASATCVEAAAARPAVVERFLQWERSIRGSGTSSLDRRAFSLDSAAWSGHCQELAVLHGALQRQLGCAVPQEGDCEAAR